MKYVKLFEQFEESLNENREKKLSPILYWMKFAGFTKPGKVSTDEFGHENYVFSGGNDLSWEQVEDKFKNLMKKTIYGQQNHFSDGREFAIKLNKDKKSITLIALKDKIPSIYFRIWFEKNVTAKEKLSPGAVKAQTKDREEEKKMKDLERKAMIDSFN
jgi:hypothetical protein